MDKRSGFWGHSIWIGCAILSAMSCSEGRNFGTRVDGEAGEGSSGLVGPAGAGGAGGFFSSGAGGVSGAVEQGEGGTSPHDRCEVDPCLNGGVCEADEGLPICSCEPTHNGEFCETAVGGCASEPCLNGGTCVAEGDGYSCDCEAGYGGTNCETDIDDCASMPCQNGGQCADGVDTFTCECDSRHTGTTCQYLEVKVVAADFLGGAATEARTLSHDGKVLLMNAEKGTRYDVARMVDFGVTSVLSFPSPYSTGINSGFGLDQGGGIIVGGVEADSGRRDAFKMIGNVFSTLDLSLLGADDTTFAYGVDVSADGSVVIGRLQRGGNGTTSFFCKSGQACREIPVDPAELFRTATAVSGDGTIVVGSTFPPVPDAAPGTAWRWVTSEASAVPLSLPSVSWTFPSALNVSRNGQVIVGQVEINGVAHAARWSGASLTTTDLGTGRAEATSANGSVTVGSDGNVAVVWLGTTRHTLASLLGTNPDLDGVSLTSCVAVSDDGKVVAVTGTVGGVKRALMARLP